MGDAYHRLALRYVAHNFRSIMAKSLFHLQFGRGKASGYDIVV